MHCGDGEESPVPPPPPAVKDDSPALHIEDLYE
jgi:hypothetical protein